MHTCLFFLYLVLLCINFPTSGKVYSQSNAIRISWQTQNSGLSVSFRGLSAVSEKVAWVSGSRGSFARTIDGGQTWVADSVAGADSLDFRDIEAFDENAALLMSAGNGKASRIYKTIDSGKNWQLLYTNVVSEGFFDGMAFWDRENGIGYGDPVDGCIFILLTADGGNSWQRVPPEALPPIREGEYSFAASGTGITVQGEKNVWICTGGSAARVLRSVNKGRTWEVAETPIISGEASTGIFSLAFRDALNGIIVGGDYQKPEQTQATVARTMDGGKTWKLVDRTAGVSFRSCVAYLPDAGKYILVAVGSHGASYSADDGWTWQQIVGPGFHTLSIGNSIYAAWAAGAGGRVAKLKLD